MKKKTKEPESSLSGDPILAPAIFPYFPVESRRPPLWLWVFFCCPRTSKKLGSPSPSRLSLLTQSFTLLPQRRKQLPPFGLSHRTTPSSSLLNREPSLGLPYFPHKPATPRTGEPKGGRRSYLFCFFFSINDGPGKTAPLFFIFCKWPQAAPQRPPPEPAIRTRRLNNYSILLSSNGQNNSPKPAPSASTMTHHRLICHLRKREDRKIKPGGREKTEVKQIWKGRRPEWTKSEKEKRKLKSTACDFGCFCRSRRHRRQGREEKEKAGQIHPFPGICLRRRVEEMRRHYSGGAEGLPCNSRLFWGYFVIFYLCDVLFVLF